jgi:hypothetical protein
MFQHGVVRTTGPVCSGKIESGGYYQNGSQENNEGFVSAHINSFYSIGIKQTRQKAGSRTSGDYA